MCGSVLLSCEKDKWPSQPDWSQFPKPEEVEPLPEPAPCGNIIVAHRGGATEAGIPENSRASARYAMGLKLYGVECDVYLTKDQAVVVAHANSKTEIGGLQPSKATLKELRASTMLSNRETLPTLEDMLDIVMEEGSCTRLVIDIKRIDYPAGHPEIVVNTTRRVCEIVNEKRAGRFVHLLCTGFNAKAMEESWALAKASGLSMAMNSAKDLGSVQAAGFNWLNVNATSMVKEAGGNGSFNFRPYLDAGIGISVYNIDKQAGDSNAVYSESAVNFYKNNRDKFRMLCTNYPAWLKKQLY